MMIERCLLHKTSTSPITFIILLPPCTRLLIVIHTLSITALLQTLLSPCCLIIAEICLGIHVIGSKYSFITPAYDLFVSFIKALALSFSSDYLCLRPSGLLLFELLGKTYQWTQGTLSTTFCQFKTNYTCTKGS